MKSQDSRKRESRKLYDHRDGAGKQTHDPRAKLHFREAYRYEKLYDTKDPVIDRVGLQDDAMTVAVCTDNEKIDEDIKLFSQTLSVDDELVGERLSTLSIILKEMGY